MNIDIPTKLSWDVLPDELLLQILCFVPKENLHTLRMVSKRWKVLAQDRFTFGRKLSINVVVLGPQNAGKSTLITQLLLKNGQIPAKTMEKLSKEAEDAGCKSYSYAWYHAAKDEKERRATSNIHRMELEFSGHNLTILDTPGHVDYVKNTIAGVTQADHAVVVVPAYNEHFFGQLSRIEQLVQMCRIAGLKEVIVAVNQFDAKNTATFEYEKSFNNVVDTMKGLFKKCSFPADKVYYVPISGLMAQNLTSNYHPDLSWYTGPNLFDLLRALEMPARESHKPLRILIDRAYKVPGIGTVVTGTVIQGIVYLEQNVKIGPIGIITQIKSLHLAIPKKPIQVGYPGDHIGMALRGVSAKDCGARKFGLITSLIGDSEKTLLETRREKKYSQRSMPEHLKISPKEMQRQSGVFPCKKFTATVAFLNPIGKIKVGYSPTLHCHNAQVPIKISSIKEIVKRKESNTGRKLFDSALLKNDVAIIEFETKNKLAIDTAVRCQKLGRFLLRDGHSIVGAGVVLETEYTDYDT